MTLPRAALLTWAAVACGVIAAEEHPHHSGGMGAAAATTALVPVPHEVQHEHGSMPILETELTASERAYWANYSTASYFNLPAAATPMQRRTMHAHVTAMLLVTCVVYPVSLMVGHVAWKPRRGQPRALVLKTAHTGLVVCGAVVLFIGMWALHAFHARGPALPELRYPGNVYAATSVIVVVLTVLNLLGTCVRFALACCQRALTGPPGGGQDPPHSLDTYEMIPAVDHRHQSQSSQDSDLTAALSMGSDGALACTHKPGSLGGGKPARSSPFGGSPRDSFDENLNSDLEAHRRALTHVAGSFTQRLASVVIGLTSWPLFIMLAVHCLIGLAVGNLFGQGLRVFNLLAHWIKGGVFVTLGIVSLARYCGCGASKGWAWNRCAVPLHPNSALHNLQNFILPNGSMITMEFIETFLIFFYGTTNVFLEHLSNQDGQWHAKDLQHVSIAFMYIGCGLCGLLIEYKLSGWRRRSALQKGDSTLDHYSTTGTPGFTPNPFPTFTIFWTGILMSQHAQASATSTAIHVQWGNLLSYGSFFRLLTYVLLILKPNTDSKPSKPFTELITSFCLLCGGLIFMESTDQVVEALEYRGLTGMFTFNLSVGFTTLFMAWEIILLHCKDWLENVFL
ncbi:LADA_0E14004g1_1 [Lachancea dasiensis]|uniref:LADA_0E14004g1_1 n=1 Tax=Lachancea dasiensis TaxID=1072105 RepID=A0A1G4JFU0_9SACH|nr:LADA_0E14004g1_1 [Lachancea dasiensis]